MAGSNDGREVPPPYGYGYPFPVYRTQAPADYLQQFLVIASVKIFVVFDCPY